MPYAVPKPGTVGAGTFCGKGDPMQLAHVGHGVAPARFRNVQVRSAS